jgi:hypothetical protein
MKLKITAAIAKPFSEDELVKNLLNWYRAFETRPDRDQGFESHLDAKKFIQRLSQTGPFYSGLAYRFTKNPNALGKGRSWSKPCPEYIAMFQSELFDYEGDWDFDPDTGKYSGRGYWVIKAKVSNAIDFEALTEPLLRLGISEIEHINLVKEVVTTSAPEIVWKLRAGDNDLDKDPDNFWTSWEHSKLSL